NKEKEVVFIRENARPADGADYERIYPKEKAMYVLELNAGTANSIGLKKGDNIKF
ncbi:DUF192 domain-containing protein, partial [Candidatus Omnitrophota bacterium]